MITFPATTLVSLQLHSFEISQLETSISVNESFIPAAFIAAQKHSTHIVHAASIPLF